MAAISSLSRLLPLSLPLPSLLSTQTLPAIAIHIHIPASLSGIWDSVLRAVPKKKTSYGKKRSRQLAGKALKDTIAINKCPACGAPKRSHLLCPDCVAKIHKQWRQSKEDTVTGIEPSSS